MADTQSNIISWTPANWVTVVLMVSVAYFVVGAVAKIWQQKRAAAA